MNAAETNAPEGWTPSSEGRMPRWVNRDPLWAGVELIFTPGGPGRRGDVQPPRWEARQPGLLWACGATPEEALAEILRLREEAPLVAARRRMCDALSRVAAHAASLPSLQAQAPWHLRPYEAKWAAVVSPGVRDVAPFVRASELRAVQDAWRAAGWDPTWDLSLALFLYPEKGVRRSPPSHTVLLKFPMTPSDWEAALSAIPAPWADLLRAEADVLRLEAP